MQRLKEGQAVLMMVGERMAVCTVVGFDDGAAVLVVTERQRGGPMPEFSPDAQMTFEYGPNLVMLNGTLRHGLTDRDFVFAVSDGVQVPPRRRDTRLRVRLPVTVTLPSGERRDVHTADVSARGLGVEGVDHAAQGQTLDVRLELPTGGAITATARVVRIAGGVTALLIESYQEGGREDLSRFVITQAGGLGDGEGAGEETEAAG
jgi:PilZ domain-containing protein